jgi:hypothetical protein
VRVWGSNKLLKEVIRQTEDTPGWRFSCTLTTWRDGRQRWKNCIYGRKRLLLQDSQEDSVLNKQLQTPYYLPIVHVYCHTYMKRNLRKARVSFMSQPSVKEAAGVYKCIMWPFTMFLVSRKSQLERMWRKGSCLLQGAGNRNCLQKATERTKNESVVCTRARIESEASNVRSRKVISDPRYHLISGNECAIQGWLTSLDIRKCLQLYTHKYLEGLYLL